MSEKVRAALALGLSVRTSELVELQRAHRSGEIEPLVRRDLARAASHPDLHPAIHQYFRHHKDRQVRFGAVFHPSVTDDERAEFLREKISADMSPASLDESGMRWLAESPNRWARHSVASSLGAPADLLTTLADDDDENVRRAVAHNVATDASTLTTLSGDTSERVRMCVARHPSTPRHILDGLVDRVPFEAFATNPNCGTFVVLCVLTELDWDRPAKIGNTLGEDFDPFQSSTASNLDLPEPVFESLWSAVQGLDTSNGRNLRSSLANNPNLPQEVAGLIAENLYVPARRNLAGNTSVPPDLHRKLRADSEDVVVAELASNPSISVETWQAILSRRITKPTAALAKNPRTTVEQLRELYEHVDGNELLGQNLGIHPLTPADLLARLANHPSYRVRKRVAQNYATSEELLDELSDDRDAGVAVCAVKAPVLPLFLGVLDPNSDWFGGVPSVRT